MNERDFERREKARQDAMFDAQFADEPTSDVEYADEPPCKTGSQCTNKCQRCGEINPAEIHTCSPEPQVNGWPLYSGLPKLIKPTQKQVIAWARETGLERIVGVYADGSRMVEVPNLDLLERFATLAYEAGRKDENEACKLMLEQALAQRDELAAALRARREQ